MKLVEGLAYVTAEEMATIDKMAIEEFGIDVLSLMENAGHAVALLARRVLGGRVEGRRLTCLIGRGNNGGDGLVAARHLHNWGAEVTVALSHKEGMTAIPSKQLQTVERMDVRVEGSRTDMSGSELIVDALLGYNSKGNPRGEIAEMIKKANGCGAPILAIDIPSGLDTTTGEPNDPCISAEETLTLGFPKTGFLNPKSRRYVGKLFLGDVSIPLEVYRRHSQKVSLFTSGPVVEVGKVSEDEDRRES